MMTLITVIMLVISFVLIKMLTRATMIALKKCISMQYNMRLIVYFVYSDVISEEWSQCQVDNSWSKGLMHINIS